LGLQQSTPAPYLSPLHTLPMNISYLIYSLSLSSSAGLTRQALFDNAESYYDVNTVNETRNQTYKRLAKLGGSVGVPEDKLLDKLWISDKPAADGSLNTGNSVTNDLKVLVRFNRKQGVHVTPTVVRYSHVLFYSHFI